tara:strand:- start:4815 stop:6467 length:1653 start_codon:yes stop_codon:yes gene_type:complete
MAVIKINRSTSRIQAPTTPNLEAARLDQSLALQIGNSLSFAGKLVEDTKKKTKKQEDKNTFRKVKLELDRDIIAKKTAYDSSTNIEDADNFLKEIDPKEYRELLKQYNPEVQTLLTNYLYQEGSNEFKNLYTKIISNHLNETIEGDSQDIMNLDMEEASNDPIKRKQAKDKKSILFSNPEFTKRYSAKALAKLKSESELRTKKFQLAFRTENDPISILQIGKEQFEKEEGLTPVEADIAIKNAENALISKMNLENLEAERVERADTKQKISNYIYMVRKFKDDDDPPSLDNINDIYKLGQINSAQRNSLYKMYNGEVEVSDYNILDFVNGAIASASAVDEIDTLRETIILNPEVLSRLNVKDAEKFINIFEKYDQDQPGWTNYTNLKKKLEASLGKSVIGNAFWSAKKVDTDDEYKYINAIDMFDQLVLKGVDPKDAYTQTATAYLDKSQLPNIYEVSPIQTISLPNPSEEDFKNPAKYFEDRRTEIANIYKSAEGTISIEQFARDIDSIDTMEDTFLMRQEKFGTAQDAFSSENTGSGFTPIDPNKPKN